MPATPAAELGERVATLEERLHAVHDDLRELLLRVDGPPWERSIRGRLHVLEAESAAAKVATRTLAEVQKERRQAEAARDEALRTRWGTREKLIAAITAAFLAAAPYVTMFYGRRG